MERGIALLGILVLLGIGWVASTDRKAIRYGPIGIAMLLQVAIAFLVLRTSLGTGLMEGANELAVKLLGAVDEGTAFVFGEREPGGAVVVPRSFALQALPVVVFTASLSAVLYHWGALQWVVRIFARGLRRTLRLSGAESVATAANVFLSMTDAPLLIRPYLAGLTRSELFCVMTAGLATVAGAVFGGYVKLLGTGYTGYLLAACFMSAPAAVALAKLMVPEKEVPATLGGALLPRGGPDGASPHSNTIEAAADGARVGVEVAIQIAGMLIAFLGLIALVNLLLGWIGGLLGFPDCSLQGLLGWAMSPLAWLMGVPWRDAPSVGVLLGEKLVLNEFVAYEHLAAGKPLLEERSVVIASFALCGFANFGSLAILIGGIGILAPGRRADVVRDGLRAIAAGSLATILTGAVAGMLYGSPA